MQSPNHVAIALAALLAAAPASALDTTEVFDPGPTNAELHMGYGGVGRAPTDRELSKELVFGYGLSNRASAYLATCLAVDQATFARETALCFGMLSTAVDTDHFDVDLMLDVEAAGNGLDALGLAPGIELNFDRDPGMSGWGLYVRSAFVSTHPGSGLERLQDLVVNPGAYLRVSDRFEVLVEYDAVWGLGVGRDRTGDATGLAIGLNTFVSPAIELISQVHRTSPVESEQATWSVGLGLVATLE